MTDVDLTRGVAPEPPVFTAAVTTEELVRLLDIAAKGREEYAEGIGESDNPALVVARADLLASARTFRQAIQIVSGDLSILYSVLPSWRWNDVPLPELHHQEP